MREKIVKLIKDSVRALQKEGKLPKSKIPEILVEYPRKRAQGDYAINIAMVIAKQTGKSPMDLANLLRDRLKAKDKGLFEKIEVVKPGFINFFVSKKYLQKQTSRILKEKEEFGNLKFGKKEKVNIEFISANPTGSLTLGNGRGGFCGDVLANVLEKAGFKVKREYYINDVGEQIKKLGHSVIGDSEAVYKGAYIKKLKKKILGSRASQYSAEEVGEKAAEAILKEMIKPSVKKMGIDFDVWFSEKSLYKKGEVDKILSWLKNKKLTYKKEEALWFKSTKFGDDKDRVLVKAGGEKTYFASDIAYLKNKFKRDFKKLIFFWGADHHGYVKRMEAAVKALGCRKEQADFIIMQLVRLFEKGKQVRMSKRAGIYITLDELISGVGLDVARFFFLMRSAGSHLNFDMDLAKERSEKNPVYYIQYAYARICSILEKAKAKINSNPRIVELLDHPSELNLIKQLTKFPEIIEDTAKDYQVQRIPQYAINLAAVFHQFYRDCQVLTDDKKLSQARLYLILATKVVLKDTLDLMGISAPSKM